MSRSETTDREILYADFVQFNGILLSVIILLWIITKYVPHKKFTVNSKIILDVIFPLVYFTSFSFFFGALFLAGNCYLTEYIGLFVKHDIVDIGIVGAYTGTVALIFAQLIKTILETLFGVVISSSFTMDLFGMVLGRIFLLTFIYMFV